MFCWENLDSGIHGCYFDTYLNIAAYQIHPFMAKVFPYCNSFFQQDKVPCDTAKLVQEWL